MPVATALITANEPHPLLAEEAVQQALEQAGLAQANSVLLFLTPEFSRQAQATVTAAARAAQCTQVAGGIASGVLTESGWALDRPAAAVMVFGDDLAPGFAHDTRGPLLSYAGGVFPPAWDDSTPRFGSTFSGSFAGSSAHTQPAVWQQSRMSDQQRFSLQFSQAELATGVSPGWHQLGKPQPIDSSSGYDLKAIGGQNALDHLKGSLPAALRLQPSLPLHQLSAILYDAGQANGRAIPIIAANPDQTLTLAERIRPDQLLVWGIRQPDTAEDDMRQCVEQLAQDLPEPSCALMFSCIGRGPYFYGGEDRDLDILRQRFPGLPILGTYGTGQIAPASPRAGLGNRQLENAVVTALIRSKI